MIKILVYSSFVFFWFVSCTTTQTAQTEDVSRDISNVPDDTPEWYDHSQTYHADSVAFTGTALAAASDSSEARRLSVEQALSNVKYSIDQFVEDKRSEMAEENNNSVYETPEFIISLRNAIQEIEFTDYEEEIEHVEQEGSVHHIYSRIRVDRQTAIRALENELGDEQFISGLKQS